MKKLLLILFISLFFNGINSYAQDKCNLWYDYQEKQILSKLRNTLSEYETETLLGITKTDINILIEE